MWAVWTEQDICFNVTRQNLIMETFQCKKKKTVSAIGRNPANIPPTKDISAGWVMTSHNFATICCSGASALRENGCDLGGRPAWLDLSAWHGLLLPAVHYPTLCDESVMPRLCCIHCRFGYCQIVWVLSWKRISSCFYLREEEMRGIAVMLKRRGICNLQ